MSDTRTDWRHRRAERTRRALIEACRGFMGRGHFRPTMQECCAAAGRSPRTGFEHFHSIEALHREALEDPETRRAIVGRLVGTGDQATAQAFVTGRG